MNKCKAVKIDTGEPCGAPAVGNNGYCFFHDPDREDERQVAREKGARSPNRKKLVLDGVLEIKNVSDVKELISKMITEIMDTETSQRYNAIAKARAVGYLTGFLLKAFELCEMEDRMDELEKKIADTTGGFEN
jgi:hypothetical protein